MASFKLKQQIAEDLEKIQSPSPSWIVPSSFQYDVVIIGAGMAGLAAAFALQRLGVSNIQIFDQNETGLEGPWLTYARMPTLRSTKELVGPALDIPSLTFHAWYEHLFGKEKWERLRKIPTNLWMDYLCWLRHILSLPVENKRTLTNIQEFSQGLQLQINDQTITTRKLILATGRGGFGGSRFPFFVYPLPKRFYAHTNESFSYETLKNKRIGIIGGGASGFDAAETALECGAKSADILIRRPSLPHVNKAASLTYTGFFEGYYDLDDNQRWQFLDACYRDGIPPPVEVLERMKEFPHFQVLLGREITRATTTQHEILIDTNKGSLTYDFLILATGFEIDGFKQPELAPFMHQILLWKDRPGIQHLNGPYWFYQSPYLGPHFQFLEKMKGEAPFLKNIYCFNYAATLSHGQLSGDIPGIGRGAQRLARGITKDFFTEDWMDYDTRLKEFQVNEFIQDNYKFFQN
ncbi:NAD(P)-binding domain-containing protein [Parachlamydia acanthamoebae]|uniref:NAD(P)-binding domain-containing protein n=1 Tax=Parachlamydia acanthamoebae TaxID=83552 RepID=UPI0024E209B0|nr:NAD(P)-binding domain-containing protein [Parachlamydia acanthamoebae]